MEALIDKLFFPSKRSDTSLIKKFSGSQSFLKYNNSLFQNIPSEYQQDFLDNSLFALDYFDGPPANGSKLNIHSIFRTFNPSLTHHIPKLSPCASLMQEYLRIFSYPPNMMTVDMTSEFTHFCDLISLPKMKEKTPAGDSGLPRKGSLSNQLIMSLAETTLPVTKTQLNVTVANKRTLPLIMVQKHMDKDYNLDQQMANKKAKELQKRSKKRRRRQKKNSLLSSVPAKGTQSPTLQVNCEIRKESSRDHSSTSKTDNCDILCDVTISHGSKSVQIVLPNMSSFVVTVESGGEEDSDWDTTCESDWTSDDSEFQLCGLFITNLTTTNSKNILANDIPCDKERDLIQAKLKEVNKRWNESAGDIKAKQKSPSLVSFAPEVTLVEIFPVEMFDRKGEWEIYATERLRFKRRINEMEALISPCLSSVHREKIYKKYYQTVL